MGVTADTTSEPYWEDAIAREQSALRITPDDVQDAMEAYSGSADLWQTYTLDGMNLYDVLQRETEKDEYVLEIGCNSGKSTAELQDLLTDDTSTVGIDLYRTGSFEYDGPTYAQAAASNLPFQNDAFDTVVAPTSLGSLVTMGILHQVSREKRRNSELLQDMMDTVAPEERAGVRQEWADVCIATYVEQVLAEAARVTQEDGSFLFADGQLYLLAENTEDGWQAVEGRGYVKDWKGGGKTVRRAEDFYSAWIDEMDDNRYSEETIVRRIPADDG